MSSLARYLNPDVIQQVSRLDLRARFIVEGFLAGLHASPFHGMSVDFSEHRKYTKGDDPRTIDWNVFGRTDRLYVRRYQAETHLDCHLFVDVSASMGYVGPATRAPRTTDEPPPGSKMMYAIHLAAALGYMVTRQTDAIGLYVLGDGLQRMLPARSRQTHLVQLLTTLASIRPAGTTGLARGAAEALARVSHRGLIVLISDLLTDPNEVIQILHEIRHRGHDLIVMHVLDAAEAYFPFDGMLRLEEPETGAIIEADAAAVRKRYLAGVAQWRKQLDDSLSAARADYVPLDTSMPFDKALIEFLQQRSRRR